MKHRFITFLTDFGLQDDFVGTCHGVMRTIAPDVQIIDITHGIPAGGDPRRARSCSRTRSATCPSASTSRSSIPASADRAGRSRCATRDGRVFIGPDNGLLVRAAERDGPVAAAHELANSDFALPSVSRTFHGRDLFSPAAAHVALGVELAELGPPVDPEVLVRLDVPRPELGARRIRATVLYVDRFGNVQLNLTREHLEQAGVVPGTKVELELGTERYYAVAARTFGDARPGDIILYEDAYRNVSIAINRGSAADMFGVEAGRELRIHVDSP